MSRLRTSEVRSDHEPRSPPSNEPEYCSVIRPILCPVNLLQRQVIVPPQSVTDLPVLKNDLERLLPNHGRVCDRISNFAGFVTVVTDGPVRVALSFL